MTLKRLALLFCLPFAVLPTFAQQTTTTPAPVARDPQAVALLQQCSQAMGTPNASSAILASGQVTSTKHPGEQGTITIELQGYGLMRRHSSFSDTQEVEIVNNGQIQFTRNSADVPVAPWQATYFRPDFVPALACSVDLARPQMNISYVGLETVNEVQSHHIRFFASPQVLPDGSNSLDPIISAFDVYLNAESLTVVKTKRFVFSLNAIENHSDWETYYLDYRPASGVLMPFHIQHFLAGQLTQDILMSTYQMNASISTQDFSISSATN
jgi:hypothetical protein